MNFHDLGQALRRETKRRLAAGELTQQQIASLTGFRQAHISNYLNGRRALSLAGLDRLLRSQNMDVRDLVPSHEGGLNLHAAGAADAIPIFHPEDWSQPTASSSAGYCSIPVSCLPSRKAPAERADWHRLIALRATPENTAGMIALLPAGSLAVVDRHDILLPPAGTSTTHIYAAWAGNTLRFTHLEAHGPHTLLRPNDPAHPAALLPAAQLGIIGRVCSIARPA